MYESSFEDSALPAPVFVDQSGLRGRLLRGLGWPVSVVGAILAVAMGSSLIGVQADAPAMSVPAQPSRSAAPSPSPVASVSPTASRPSSSSSSPPRTATRSATPQTKTTAATPKPTTIASRAAKAKPSGQPATHP
ncbi:hypothetical protein [Streptomyces sp. NPDC046685]|uniref:hypothetical protein n=1 Tax=Streptomyces sp. NPDC046685 TaxID=3157202 RepID=UPI0033FAB4E8